MFSKWLVKQTYHKNFKIKVVKEVETCVTQKIFNKNVTYITYYYYSTLLHCQSLFNKARNSPASHIDPEICPNYCATSSWLLKDSVTSVYSAACQDCPSLPITAQDRRQFKIEEAVKILTEHVRPSQ